jgi:3-deoxy-D-manno-octulosonic-acid transferase
MAHAEIVIMGGSFAPKGGQNPLEAIRLGKLVLCGPDMRDFAQEVAIFSKLGCLQSCANNDTLIKYLFTVIPILAEQQVYATQGQQWLQGQQADVLARYVALSDDTST